MLNSLSNEAQQMLDRFRQHWAEYEAAPSRVEGRIAIVGLKGAGKKTLCNSLWGWHALDDDLPDELVRKLGLFTLITLPDDPYDESTVLYHLESAELVVYLVDGVSGAQAEDIRWIARLRALPAALIIGMNKIDQMEGEITPDKLAELQDQFARPVVALSAQDTRAVHERFLPVLLKASPHLAVPLAAEITGLRWQVVRRLIRESAILGGLVTLENGATVDVHALLDLQRRLVRQIARAYGYADLDEPERASVSAVLQRLVLDYTTQALAKLGPLGGSLAGALLGASGTWAMGHTVQAHYNGGTGLARWLQWLRRNGQHGNTTQEQG